MGSLKDRRTIREAKRNRNNRRGSLDVAGRWRIRNNLGPPRRLPDKYTLNLNRSERTREPSDSAYSFGVGTNFVRGLVDVRRSIFSVHYSGGAKRAKVVRAFWLSSSRRIACPDIFLRRGVGCARSPFERRAAVDPARC